MAVKQVIVIRKDLKMRRGKEIAQGAHASQRWLVERLLAGQTGSSGQCSAAFSGCELEWMRGLHIKVTVQVESEAELVALHEAARATGLESWMIQDEGATEFHGALTRTALALGPDDEARIDPLTRHLKLY